MGPIEKQWATSLTRRRALAGLSGMLAGSPSWLRAQLDPRSTQPQPIRTPSLDEMIDVFDFAPVAQDNVHRLAWNWTSRAGDSEWGLRRNRHAFDWVDLVERPNGTAESMDTSTEVLGVRMSHPIFAAPNSLQGQMHPSGEAGTYQALSATGGTMGIASGTSVPHAEIAAAANGPRWNQSYPGQDMERNRIQHQGWVDLGTQAIMITIDQQAADYDSIGRHRWTGANPGSSEPPQPRPARDEPGPQRYGVPIMRMWPTWDFVSRVRDLTPQLPVLIKGILTGEDARIVVERGFDGIIVSNHGARTLEYVPSTIEVLPEIVEAVAGRIPVLIDSGFRRGSDVFKALALGADAVAIGRATRWGLGAFGPAGVQRVVEIMERELREAMVATGRSNIASIDQTAVRTNFI